MSRTILQIAGADAESFLQGLVSNDVSRLGDGLLYAALLTPQGKYVADFLLFRRDGAIMLDVAAPLTEALVRKLSMYRLRADVTISETDLKLFRGTTAPPPAGAMADPRHPALGWRLYGAQEGDDGSDFEAIRVAHCIPETGIELTPETYILEAGFERLGGVDFRKGCYVGQEVTARMHHKTTLRKGLETVEIEGAAPVGTPIIAQGRTAGTLLSQAAGKAIAYLRFERAAPEMQAAGARLRRCGAGEASV